MTGSVMCAAVIQAELLLSEEAQEIASVSDLKLQLQDLQQQVDEASQVSQQHWGRPALQCTRG